MSPTLAFGWHVWTRHRLGLTLCAGYWLLLLILANTLPGNFIPNWLLPFLFVLPCSAALGYLLTIFSIGLEAKLELRDSGFPARLWTLPLRTRSLVGWPMLWGTSVLMLAWLTVAWGVLRTAGFDLGILSWLPALILAVTLAWLQVLVWSPFPLPGFRLFVIGPLIGTGVIVPQVLIEEFGIGEWLAAALFAVQLPVAYGIAVYGVARARRGDMPSWTWPGWRSWLRWTSVTSVGRPFVAPARAQLWFEWRRHGLGFPIVLAGMSLICLPMVPWIAEFFENSARVGIPVLPPFVLREIGGLWLATVHLLWMPLLMASVSGLDMGKLPGRDRTQVLSSFLATRPASAAAFIRAKFEMAALSTLAGWAVFLLGFLIWFALGGKATEMAASFDALRQRHPAGPFWGGVALLVVGVVVLTWLLMIQGIWLGLVREKWRIVGVLFILGCLIGLAPCINWLVKSTEQWQTFADLLPWLAGGVVALKCLLAAWSLHALKRRDVLSPAVIGGALAIWIVFVVGLFGVLYWLLPGGLTYVSAIVIGIALLVPLTRLALGPLALDWNRHR